MQPVPISVLKSFETILEQRGIWTAQRANYQKWLRYFRDFGAKYTVPEARSDQVRLFIEKLWGEKSDPVPAESGSSCCFTLFSNTARTRNSG